MERCALLNINPGDILIVCHSNYSDSGKLGQTDLDWITPENHKELWRAPDLLEWIELLLALPDYTDYFYTIDLFYDNCLHMTNEGAEIRTKQLIKDIKKWMEK